jgi:hypothetical protein
MTPKTLDPFYMLYAMAAAWLLLGWLTHRFRRRNPRHRIRIPEQGCTANAYELFRRLG